MLVTISDAEATSTAACFGSIGTALAPTSSLAQTFDVTHTLLHLVHANMLWLSL